MQRKRPCFHIWSCQVMIGQINKANRKQSASSPRRSYDVEFLQNTLNRKTDVKNLRKFMPNFANFGMVTRCL